MEWIIEIISKNNEFPFDPAEVNIPIKDIRISKLYYITGELTRDQISKSISQLFQDKIIEKHKVYPVERSRKEKKITLTKKFRTWEVEVFYKKEVTDPATSYIIKALTDINISAENILTGYRYVIKGNLNLKQIRLFSRRFLANLIVQDIFIRNL